MKLVNAQMLDEILFEAMEDPYNGGSIDEIVTGLATKFQLSVPEQSYIHEKATSINPRFILKETKE